MTKTVEFHEKLRGMNEALVLGSLRQHELTEFAEAINVKLEKEIAERKQVEAALRESEGRYRNLFDSMDEGYCVIEMIFDEHKQPVDYRFLEVNRAFEKQSGLRDATGKRMLEFVSDIEGHWLTNYGRVALTGESIRFFNEYKGLNRSFDVYAFRLGGPDGQRVAVLFTDVTQRKKDEEALVTLAAIVESSDDAIISKDLHGTILSWNRGAERLFGYTAQEIVTKPVSILMPPGRLDEEARILEKIRHGEPIEHYETVRRRKNGTLIDVSLTVSPLRNDKGLIVGASKIARDISERVRAKRHRELLMAELDHRVKNTLTLVQSIARQTILNSTSLDQFRRAFDARLMALSETQNLLTRDEWRSAPLRDIIMMELAPYDREESRRVTVVGEDVKLNSEHALALGMTVHELATNAAKYGAFSVPNGKVEVTWDVVTVNDGPVLELRWIESGGPVVEKPDVRGFGSQLIEHSLAGGKESEARLDFHPEGVRFSLKLPFERVKV